MSDISSQTTEIVFMGSISICFGISWVYLYKTRELATPASTHFFLTLQLIIVSALVIYYILYKFGNLNDKTFNWAIVGTGLGAIVMFGFAFVGGWFSNKATVLGLSSGSGSSGNDRAYSRL